MEEVFILKEYKTLNQQINILSKRGLVIKNKEDAKLYLLTNNYYNIINGYSKFFQNENDKYISGTTFEEIKHLYLFDKKIKHALFSSIIDTESHLKSIFAHRFSEKFSKSIDAYLDLKNYKNAKPSTSISTISHLYEIIKKQNMFPNSSISHYTKKYNLVPLWVIVNYINFGTLRYMLASAGTDIQNSVARDLINFIQLNIDTPETFPPETMLSFIENINDVRNICAHNNRLIGFNCKRDSRFWKSLHKKYHIQTKDTRRSVYSVFITLQCFLTNHEYGTLHNTILKLTKRLDRSLKAISVNNILVQLGFPNDWHKNTKKIIY